MEDEKEKKEKEKMNLYRYIAKANSLVYTLISPVALLLLLYYYLVKHSYIKPSALKIVFLAVLGIITGYWSLYKELNNKK